MRTSNFTQTQGHQNLSFSLLLNCSSSLSSLPLTFSSLTGKHIFPPYFPVITSITVCFISSHCESIRSESAGWSLTSLTSLKGHIIKLYCIHLSARTCLRKNAKQNVTFSFTFVIIDLVVTCLKSYWTIHITPHLLKAGGCGLFEHIVN